MANKRTLPYPVKILSHGLRLPSYISFFEKKAAQHDAIIEGLSNEVAALKNQLQQTTTRLRAYEKMDDRLIDLQHQIASGITAHDDKKGGAQQVVVNATVSDNHRFDQFYKAFEDTFRGSEELIRGRLLEHLPLFEGLPKNIRKKPTIDIGCGRGELLSVLSDNGFKVIGIDMNVAMVKRANDMGFEAYATDARSYLASLKSSSVAAITGFHIVEHIPFESLMDIFSECYRSVARGGFVLFETPNPETFSVGAHTFYLDPSHQRPVPPQLLQFMLEYAGFTCEIIRMHEIEEMPKSTTSEVVRKLHKSAYGPADYAVVGRKV